MIEVLKKSTASYICEQREYILETMSLSSDKCFGLEISAYLPI